MRQNLLLGLIAIISLMLAGCGDGGVDAKQEAQTIVSKLFSPKQYATDFSSASKYNSGIIKIKDFSITPVALGKKLTFEELEVKKFDDKSKHPLFFNLNFKGLKITPDMYPHPAALAMISKLNLGDLVVDLDLEQNYVPSNKSYDIKFDLAVRQLAQLNIEVKLNNVDEAILDPEAVATPEAVNKVFGSAQIKAATFTLVNTGFMNKIKELYSANSFGAAKAGLIQQAAKATDPVQKNFFNAMSQFIDNQSSIRFGINPLEPMDVATVNVLIKNPATQKELLNKLNLTIVSQ